jgi:hypothetical protein
VIPTPKLRALREALERDGEVVFKNGSRVKREICPGCGGAGEEPIGTMEGDVPWKCPTCDGEPVGFRVTRPAGGIARYHDDEEGTGLRNAYAMALDGPTPKPQPSGDPAMFGDDPPW